MPRKVDLKTYHRFLDESGDCVFFGKRKKIIVGEEGVSKTFILGQVKFKRNLESVRNEIRQLQKEIDRFLL